MSGGDWSGGGDGGGDWGGGEGASWGDGGSSGGDSFSETSSESWLSRVGKAFMAIPIGLILFAVSFVVLFWNEGRAVHTAQGLAEGKAGVVSVEADRVDQTNQGKLVHVTGEATATETLTDPQLAVSAKALKLQRIVQMYQWKERSETKKRKKLGGGEERVTTYHYDKGWVGQPIDSSGFKRPDGHQNPDHWPLKGWTGQAQTVTLGAFKLPAGLVDQIRQTAPLPVGETERDALPDDLKEQARLDAGRFYLGENPSDPKVGDLTVAFEQVRPQVVSLLAKQSGDSFEPYATKAGTSIHRLQAGNASADEMFQEAEAENNTTTWILRLVGFILMAVGIMMVLGPLSVLADVVPFIGGIVGFGTGFLAFSIATVLSLVTIAIGWIAYRPVVGVSILVVAGLALFGFMKMARNRRSGLASPGAARV